MDAGNKEKCCFVEHTLVKIARTNWIIIIVPVGFDMSDPTGTAHRTRRVRSLVYWRNIEKRAFHFVLSPLIRTFVRLINYRNFDLSEHIRTKDWLWPNQRTPHNTLPMYFRRRKSAWNGVFHELWQHPAPSETNDGVYAHLTRKQGLKVFYTILSRTFI